MQDILLLYKYYYLVIELVRKLRVNIEVKLTTKKVHTYKEGRFYDYFVANDSLLAGKRGYFNLESFWTAVHRAA